jgi:hypothetical protein
LNTNTLDASPKHRVTSDERLAVARIKAVNYATYSAPTPVLNPGGIPDYFGSIPNYANSPLPAADLVHRVISDGMKKFIHCNFSILIN